MANEIRSGGTRSGARVPEERPDPKIAAQQPEAGEDRPGFDLGGAKGVANGDAHGVGSNTIPGGPKGSTSHGSDASGRAGGLSDPSGSRSLGNEGDAGSEAGSGPTGGSGPAS